MVVGQCRRVSQPVGGHDERWAEHGVKVVELVCNIGWLPSQRTKEDIADFVGRQIEHVCIEVTRDMRPSEDARLR